MGMQGRISRAGGAKVKRALDVQALLEWAFRVEQAQLELPPPGDVSEEDYGFGLEYILLQCAALGCKVAEAAFGLDCAMPDSGEGALDWVRGADMLPMLGREIMRRASRSARSLVRHFAARSYFMP